MTDLAAVYTLRRGCWACHTEPMAWASPDWFAHVRSKGHRAKIAEMGLRSDPDFVREFDLAKERREAMDAHPSGKDAS